MEKPMKMDDLGVLPFKRPYWVLWLQNAILVENSAGIGRTSQEREGNLLM